MMVQFCKRCLYHSHHPLNLTFNAKGICSGCVVHEEKEIIDWQERYQKLKKKVKKYKINRDYDCIVPITGANDSFYILDLVINKLKLNPLTVHYNSHYNTLSGLKNLAKLRTIFDVDFMQLVVEKEKIRKINDVTLKKFASMYWHVIAGQTVFPVQIAVKFKIPLIIWGVHQGCDQVGMFSHYDEVEMSRKYRKEHDLLGYEAEDLLGVSSNISDNDVNSFVYPSDKEINENGIVGIYLSNYFKWDSKKQHEEMIRKYKYEAVDYNNTYDNCNNINCNHYNGVHDYIKLIKYGYSKIIDHLCREIRLKKISRDNAIHILQNYKKIDLDDLQIFLDFQQMKQNDFFNIVDKFRSTIFWNKNGNKFEFIDYLKSSKIRNLDFKFNIERKLIKEKYYKNHILHKAWD